MQATRTLTLEITQRMHEEMAWLKEHYEFKDDTELLETAFKALRETNTRAREHSLHREELSRQTNTSRDDFG